MLKKNETDDAAHPMQALPAWLWSLRGFWVGTVRRLAPDTTQKDFLSAQQDRTFVSFLLAGLLGACVLVICAAFVLEPGSLGKLLEMTAVSVPTERGPMVIKAALGIAAYPRDGLQRKVLYDAADAAMYHCKRNDLQAAYYEDLGSAQDDSNVDDSRG